MDPQHAQVELHRHLEGSIRPATILDMFRRNLGMYLDTSLEELLPRMQITGSERSLVDFWKFEFFMPCIKSRADITRITREVIEDCAAEGTVRGASFLARVHPGPHRAQPCGGVEAVLDGAREVPAGMSVSFILGTPQPRGVEVAWDTVKLARDYLSSGVRGVDISDDTRIRSLEEYQAPMEWARSEGLGVTIHVGEAEGPESVRTAVERLGATRLGHGVRAVECDEVLELAVARGVVFEVCPTSNIHTRVAESYENHPMVQLWQPVPGDAQHGRSGDKRDKPWPRVPRWRYPTGALARMSCGR